MFDSINQYISNALYHVSSALLLPVMLAVVALFLASLTMLGGFIREAMDRRQTRQTLRAAAELAARSPSDPSAVWIMLSFTPSGLSRSLSRAASAAPGHRLALEKGLADLETDIAARLGRIGFVTRVGPMLGLLGTLIPFGPALAGLSNGDVRELSANLVAAFATTVVGLLAGSISFGVGSWRRAWYAGDFDDLHYIVQLLTEEPDHAAESQTQVAGNGRRPHLRIGQPV